MLNTILIQDKFEFDGPLRLQALSTILFLCQYQKVHFTPKELASLAKINGLPKLLTELSQRYDTATLARVLLDCEEPNSEWLKAITENHLKTTFLLV